MNILSYNVAQRFAVGNSYLTAAAWVPLNTQSRRKISRQKGSEEQRRLHRPQGRLGLQQKTLRDWRPRNGQSQLATWFGHAPSSILWRLLNLRNPPSSTFHRNEYLYYVMYKKCDKAPDWLFEDSGSAEVFYSAVYYQKAFIVSGLLLSRNKKDTEHIN